MENQTKSIQPTESILERLKYLQPANSPKSILNQAEKEFEQREDGTTLSGDSVIFKAMTLLEFGNGVLLSVALPSSYQTFAIQLFEQLQKEFDCKMPSEKATAELASICYTKSLFVQQKMTAKMEAPQRTSIDLQYLSILSKEYDRAHRQYLSALQTLRMMKQPALAIQVKANTAIIGNQQMVKNEVNH
jgi:hypothetical protein